jgi:hypothetical protein
MSLLNFCFFFLYHFTRVHRLLVYVPLREFFSVVVLLPQS